MGNQMPPLPSFPAVSVKRGAARGYVRDFNGKALEGAVIAVRSTSYGGAYTTATGETDAKGFYETQGWGPNFIVPTRSRIDVPYNEMWIKMAEATKGVAVKGVAFGGDRGISRVELSSDDGENWDDAKIDYPGTKLSWALWSFDWKPDEVDDYTLVVRATDGDSKVQEFEENRSFTSGITGFHKIVVHVFT